MKPEDVRNIRLELPDGQTVELPLQALAIAGATVTLALKRRCEHLDASTWDSEPRTVIVSKGLRLNLTITVDVVGVAGLPL